ncbi:hypothetical protein COV16_00645 [Candidatus Woesearchaeota archaeon CG10_big_fil_rev_8_21_14_0_10_34_8]|nr:MAG: hypothetical protein COV16_00645 [Candidatus Woesearchaeota archaeon CG10_big_fil_rev_8_21_14_0_10_34_8]
MIKEIMHIESEKKISIDVKNLVNKIAGKLPSEIVLIYSIQYKSYAENLMKELKKRGKNVEMPQIDNTYNTGQVLGCSKLKTDKDVLLIGSGRFHAINLAASSGKEVWVLDNENLSKITRGEVDAMMKKKKMLVNKFLHAGSVGIIVSSKYGQEKMKLAKEIKTKIGKKGKKAFIFLADNINIWELENFKADIWVNTACPGLFLDSNKIVNYGDVEDFL